MDYWEKADYSWSDDSKRHILTPSSKKSHTFLLHTGNWTV